MQKWNKKLIIKKLKKLAKELGHSPHRREVPHSFYWMIYNHFGGLDKAKKVDGLEIYKLKYNPIKKSSYKVSKEFAYVLGVVYGDGHSHIIEDNHGSSGIITLGVTDKDFALNFKKELEKWSGLKAKYWVNKEEEHEVNLYSVDAARIIDKFDLNKILKWKKEFQFQFMKGLFDSDGGVVGENLDNRRYAKRWVHLSNNNLILIYLVKKIFNKMKIKYFIDKRIHSGFGSKKWQYEIKIYNLKDMFKYYKKIGFSIKRKQDKLINVINSYDYYPLEMFNKAKELHKKIGFRKVAKELKVNPEIVYGWLFKNNQKQILDVKGGKL